MPDIKITGVLDTACALSPEGKEEATGFEAPFYRENQTCSPNVEGVAEWQKGNLKFVGDVGVGENSKYTKAAGLDYEAPVDPVQFFAEYGRSTYVGVGRRVTRMGFEVIRADQNDFIFRGRNFGLIPYTETEAWVGHRWEKLDLSAGYMPFGPDSLDSETGIPHATANATGTLSGSVSFFANGLIGLEEDSATGELAKKGDLGLTYTASPRVTGKLYLLTGSSSVRGANLYLKFVPFAGAETNLRAGYSKADREAIEFTAGVNLFSSDKKWQFRIEADQLQYLDREDPFQGPGGEIRFAAQLVYAYSK
jgi:hypothetical protein